VSAVCIPKSDPEKLQKENNQTDNKVVYYEEHCQEKALNKNRSNIVEGRKS